MFFLPVGFRPGTLQIINNKFMCGHASPNIIDHHFPSIANPRHTQTVTFFNLGLMVRQNNLLLQRTLQPDLSITKLTVHVTDRPLSPGPSNQSVRHRMQREIMFRTAGNRSVARHFEAPLHRRGHPVTHMEPVERQR